MHFPSILPAIALLFGSGAAQFTGQRVLSFNATATGLDISDLGGSDVVSYAYNSLWIGNIKADIAAEPFLFYLPDGALAPNLEFISFHAYDFEAAIRPYTWIGMSLPLQWVNLENAPKLPTPGASTFALNKAGYLTQSGDNKFHGCRNQTTPENSYEIFWLDNGIPEGYECTGKLYLTTTLSCMTI